MRFDQIEHGCLTDVGVKRSHNQDSFAIQLASDEEGWKQRGHLFLVADGMGAHAVGEKASEQAAHVIPHVYQKHAPLGAVVALRRSFVEANATIHACGQQNREFEGMGTTGTSLVLRADGAWVGHVGDSRCYRIRNSVIDQLSYDHSLVWEYARLQHMDPDEVEDIPSNVIHRCLGPEPLVQVDIEGPHPIEPGDIYLLCSDGLSGQVTDPEIGAVASVLPPSEACRFLVDLANLRGGPDNTTVIIVRILSGADGDKGGAVVGKRRFPRPPWWVPSLVGGTLLAVGAPLLYLAGWPTLAVALLLPAVVAVLAGIVGLFAHYQKEQKRQANEDENRPTPKSHHTRPCKIEKPLLNRLIRALETLEKRATEGHWQADWDSYKEHHARGEERVRSDDFPGAFREYCRAMQPLMKAFHDRRGGGGGFSPVWDKGR